MVDKVEYMKLEKCHTFLTLDTCSHQYSRRPRSSTKLPKSYGEGRDYWPSKMAQQEQDDDAPPPYDFSQSLSGSGTTTSITTDQLRIHAMLHSHQPIGIYHINFSDLCLSLSADTPPLNHITTHYLTRPSILLHKSGSASSPVVATANYHVLSPSISLEVAPPALADPIIYAPMDRIAVITDAWGVDIYVPSRGRKERFEWKYSSGPQVRQLGGKSKGLKLVRMSTGTVVMAFAWTVMSARKLGKFMWGTTESYGEEGDLMVLISLLAVVEKIRRDSNGGSNSSS